MKHKTLILAALGVVAVAAAGLFTIGFRARSQYQLDKSLHQASEYGNAAAAAWVAKRADLNSRDPGFLNQTPLIKCAHLGSECLETLLLLGANANDVDDQGKSALFSVTAGPNPGYAAEVLVRFGADVKLTNKEGETALQYLEKKKYTVTEELRKVLEGNSEAARVHAEAAKMRQEAKL
jgi:hypothetical protein